MSPRRRYAASPADEADGLSPAPPTIRVGTAGWTIPLRDAADFPGEGTHLQRYARRFVAAEIDTSFYRAHRPATYARWAASVPPGFRFAVKLPREITHTRKLVDAEAPMARSLDDVRALGPCLGPLLIQLPPSLAFEPGAADAFLAALRARFEGDAVCEPRHPSWFGEPADAALSRHHVARVAADPPPVPAATTPGGWPGLTYRRLHGSPTIYRSPYLPSHLGDVAQAMRSAWQERGGEAWCIFDNTAAGEAASNALALAARLGDCVRPGGAAHAGTDAGTCTSLPGSAVP